jgi:type I restriction enzyme S subunit
LNGLEGRIDDALPFKIPENWTWVRLSSIGQIVGCGRPKTDNSADWDDGVIPWLTPADMKNVMGKYVAHGERNITEYGLKNLSAQIIPKNTIVYSSRATIGYIVAP